MDLLNQFGVADCSYDLTPEQLNEKVAQSDALIVRSGTKVSIWEIHDLSNFVGAMYYSASAANFSSRLWLCLKRWQPACLHEGPLQQGGLEMAFSGSKLPASDTCDVGNCR